jgi:hypothetical protein
MTLQPERTNRMTCTVCGWTRIIDHVRLYRGGHTSVENGINECHEMLVFEEVNVRPPHATWFESEEVFEPAWVETEVDGETVWEPVALD